MATRTQRISQILNKHFEFLPQQRSADWGGIPVWNVYSDKLTNGFFITLNDNNDFELIKRKDIEDENEVVILFSYEISSGNLNKLITEAKKIIEKIHLV